MHGADMKIVHSLFYLQSVYSCILLDVYWYKIAMHGPMNIQIHKLRHKSRPVSITVAWQSWRLHL